MTSGFARHWNDRLQMGHIICKQVMSLKALGGICGNLAIVFVAIVGKSPPKMGIIAMSTSSGYVKQGFSSKPRLMTRGFIAILFSTIALRYSYKPTYPSTGFTRCWRRWIDLALPENREQKCLDLWPYHDFPDWNGNFRQTVREYSRLTWQVLWPGMKSR